MTDWIGQTLSKVLIQQRLAQGGMAEVFVGHHTTLQRAVAVKVLYPHLAIEPRLLQRFQSEAQAVAAMRHPNIVQVFDYDIVEGSPYIVMELIEGLSLEAYLKQFHPYGKRIPPETTARLITSLAAALDYAHGHGIVHRDIKPANILLRRVSASIDPALPLPLDVDVILTDFGISRFREANPNTLSGTFSGTPAYLSPEQAQGKEVDHRSDIYSLGVTLYEMLAGHPPFDASDGNLLGILLKHVNESPPPLPDSNHTVQAVVDRALAKKPEERYQHAGDLADELLKAIYGVSTRPHESGMPPLEGLLDTLDLLIEQARAYRRALPSSNTTAHTAVSALAELAQQAINEARDLAASLQPAPSAPHPFSPREFEVITLAAQGLTNKEIAYRLHLSERTVQFHMNSIFNKTTTNSRTEAVALALKQDWLKN